MRCVNKLLLILIFGIFLINVVSSAVNTQNTFARNSINQRAFDVATQLEIYLEVHSDMTLEDLKNDARFNELAVQQVGKTGYTYLIVYETGILDFHPDLDIQGGSYNNFRESFPVIWNIIDETISSPECTDSSGFYDWEDINDVLREKYTYHHCMNFETADGYTFFIGASAYLDEYDPEDDLNIFAKESIEQKAKDVAKQIEIYLYNNPDMTIEDLKKDNYFRGIAVQIVGKTGSTAIFDYDNLIQLFSNYPESEEIDFRTFKDTAPELWAITEKAQGGHSSQGFYDWPLPDGDFAKQFGSIEILLQLRLQPIQIVLGGQLLMQVMNMI